MDEALLNITQLGRDQLVKMLITLKPQGIFNQIVHTYLFLNCPTTGMQKGVKHHFGWSRSLSKNAHTSDVYIWFYSKF